MNRFDYKNFKQSKFWRNFVEKEGFQTKDFIEGWLSINSSKLKVDFGQIEGRNLEEIDFSDLLTKAKRLGLTHVSIFPNDKKVAEFNGIKKEIEKFDPRVSQIDLPNKKLDVEPERTLVLDSSKTDEGLLEDMSRVSRTKLQQSLQQPLSVIFDQSLEGFDTFYKLYQKSLGREEQSKNQIDPKKIWNSITKKDLDISYQIAIAYNPEDGDRPLESWFIGIYEGNVFVFSSGSSEIGKELNTKYFLLWKTLSWMKKNNYKYLEFEGFSNDDFDYEFKNSIGGVILTYQQPIDLIINPLKYRLLRVGSNVKNKFTLLNRK